MSSTQKEAGGYDVTFVDEVDDELKCVICCLVLRNPIQLMNCGHRYCKICLDKMQEYATRLNTELICPVDREPIDTQRAFQDKGISRMVGNLRTYCSNQGCGHVVDLRDLHNHEKACEYRETVHHNPGTSSAVSLDDILNRLQRCESDLLTKDKELLQLKFSVNELKGENKAMRQQLQFVKKSYGDERTNKDEIVEVKKQLDSNAVHLDRSMKALDSKTINLERKVGIMEETQMKYNTYNEIIQDVKKQVELTHLENVRKMVDPVSTKLLALSKDVVYIKGETNKAVKETRSTQSHVDKSLNKKKDEIDVLRNICKDLEKKMEEVYRKHDNIDNMENVMLAIDNDTLRTHDIVLKWVLEDFKQVCEVGSDVLSPIFNTHISGYLFRLMLRVNESKTSIGLYLKLHCRSDHPRPLHKYNNAYTLALHGKTGIKTSKVTLDDIDVLRDSFTISDSGTGRRGVGCVKFLSSPFDEYVINDSLFVTCTIHL